MADVGQSEPLPEIDPDRGRRPGPPSGPLAIGAVLARTFQIMLRNCVAFGLMSLLAYALLAIAYYFVAPLLTSMPNAGREIIIYVMDIPVWAMLSAGVVYGTILDLRQGARPSVVTVVSRGIASVLPAIAVGLAVILCIMLGTVLLIVPGIIIWVIYYVAIPVAVVERTGVGESLERSRLLVRGNGWRVFGVIIVLFVFQMIVSRFLGNENGAAMAIIDALGDWSIGNLVSIVIECLLVVLTAISSAVIYHDLRLLKDGGDVEQIAAVFD